MPDLAWIILASGGFVFLVLAGFGVMAAGVARYNGTGDGDD